LFQHPHPWKEKTMADYKPCLRRTATFALLAGALWMGDAFNGGSAGGQPPKSEPTPPPAADFTVKAITRLFAPPRQGFNFVISPDTPLKDLLPIPPRVSAGGPRLIDDISQ